MLLTALKTLLFDLDSMNDEDEEGERAAGKPDELVLLESLAFRFRTVQVSVRDPFVVVESMDHVSGL